MPTLREKFEFMLSFIEKDGVPDDTYIAVSVHGITATTAHLTMAPTVGDLRKLLDGEYVPSERICYSPCEKHKGLTYTMKVGYSAPMKQVCPICEPPK